MGPHPPNISLTGKLALHLQRYSMFQGQFFKKTQGLNLPIHLDVVVYLLTMCFLIKIKSLEEIEDQPKKWCSN